MKKSQLKRWWRKTFINSVLLSLVTGSLSPGIYASEQERMVENLSSMLSSTFFNESVTESVYALDVEESLTPILTPIPDPVNTETLDVSGTAQPGAEVTLYVSKDHGSKAEKGKVVAGANGDFDIQIVLQGDGIYSLTATASLAGKMSPESTAVQVILDRTPPATPSDFRWETIGLDEVKVTWISSDPDAETMKYRIERNGVFVLETSDLFYSELNVPELSALSYRVYAKDRAGNLSDPLDITTGTAHHTQQNVNTSPNGAFGNNNSGEMKVSGDGSKSVFISRATNLVEGEGNEEIGALYVKDLRSGSINRLPFPVGVESLDSPVISEDGRTIAVHASVNGVYEILIMDEGASEAKLTPTIDGERPNDFVGPPSISDDGESIVFKSAASNLVAGDTNQLADLFVYHRSSNSITRVELSEEVYDSNLQNPILSGDGKFVLFYAGCEECIVQKLYLQDISMPGGTVHLTDGSLERSISSNGRFIAYSKNEGIYVYDREAPGEAKSKLIVQGAEGKTKFSEVQLSGDGKHLIFTAFEFQPDQGYAFQGYHMYKIEVDDPNLSLALLSNPATDASSGSVSKDGSRVGFIGTATNSFDEQGDFRVGSFVVCPRECREVPDDKPIRKVSWQAPMASKDQVKLGSSLDITVHGETNRMASATIAYMQGGAEQTREIPLIEQSPGVYRGTVYIQAGMTRLNTIVGKVADKAGNMIALPAEGLPVSVSAGIRVEVSNLLNPDQSINQDVSAALNGSRLVVWSPKKKAGNQAVYQSGGAFTVIVPEAEDYKLSILSKDGALLAEQLGVITVKGEFANLTMDVFVPSTVSIKVTKEEGNAPFAYLPVLIEQAESKKVIVSGITNENGEISLPVGYIGDQIRIKVQVPSPYAAIEPVTMRLNRAQTDISLQTLIHYGSIRGIVKDVHEQPLKNVTVSVKQESRSIEAITDENGAWRVRMPEGPATITGYMGGETIRRTMKEEVVQIETSQEKSLDMILHQELTATVHLKLFTKLVGSDWKYQNLGISELNAFIPSVSKEGGKGITPTYFENGLTFKAVAGEKFQVCLYDRLGQLGSSCELVTIDEQMQATAELRLQEKTAVAGRTVIGEQGIWTLHAGFFEMDNQGKTGHAVTYYALQPGKFHVSLPKAGNYFVSITAVGDYRQDRKVTKTITVREGEITELGDLVLTRKGFFNQAGGNTLEALDSTVAEGSPVTMRGMFRNGSGESIQEPILLIRIPQGTSLVEDSVVLNGSPVDGVVMGTQSVVEVPLPADLAPGAEGAILYQLQVDKVNSESITAEIGMRFRQNATNWGEEDIARTLIRTTQISLEAPPKVDKSSFVVSGRAVPGSRVLIYDGIRLVAETKAAPGGYWSQQVTLIEEQAQGRTHALSAAAILGAYEWRSEQVFVDVMEVDEPMPIHLTMHVGGHRSDVDLTNGIARFPIVVDPKKPISFSLKFREPKRVEQVQIRLGGEEIPLTYNALTERYEGIKSTKQRHLGPIAVSYNVLPKPYQVIDNQEDILHSMPPAFRNLKQEILPLDDVNMNPNSNSESSKTYVNKVVLTSTESPGERIEAQFFYAPMPIGYHPGNSPASGPELYNLKFHFNGQLKTMMVSAIVPVEQAKRMLAGLSGSSPSLSGAPYIEIGANFKYELKTPGTASPLGLASAIYAGYDYQQKMNELNAFMDQVGTGNCTSANSIKHYNDELQNLAERLFQQLLLKYSLQMAAMGLAGAGISFLAGVGVVATSAAINYGFNAAWESDLSDLQQQYATDQSSDECEDEEEDNEEKRPKRKKDPDDDRDILDPYWIYDPSGYVFEAVETNRVEGVKATALFLDPQEQAWKVWDASLYGQQNPLRTNREGRYAWDVPEGKWQVLFEKDGYEIARSEVLEVLPPHYDVNVGIISKAAPNVDVLVPQGDDIILRFSTYMIPVTVTTDSVTLTPISAEGVDGEQMPIRIEPVQSQTSPSGEVLAKQFRIVSDTPLRAGQNYRVDVDAMVQNYAGTSMTQAYTGLVEVTAPGPVAEAVKSGSLGLIRSQNALGVSWEENQSVRFDHFRVEWKQVESGAVIGVETVEPGRGQLIIEGLQPGKNYEVKLQTIDLAGRESDGEMLTGSTLAEPRAPLNSAPGSVKEASLQWEDKGLTLRWIDPSDEDLRGIRIVLKKPGEFQFGPAIEADKAVQLFRFEGLAAPGLYTVKLEAVDTSGKRSEAVESTVTISENGGTNNGNGNGGAGGVGVVVGTPVPTKDAQLTTIRIVNGQEHYEAFEGMLNVHIPKGTLEEGAKIQIRRSQTSSHPLPSGYAAHAEYVTISSEDALLHALDLSWTYSEAVKQGMDVRKLGVYKLDTAVQGGWRYVGGFARQEQSDMSVKLDSWGTYALMTYTKQFVDLSGHWSRKDADVLISRHLMEGMDELHFSPDSPVTRAQVVKMLVNFLQQEGRVSQAVGSQVFRDVSESAWYAEAVRSAAAIGLVEGDHGMFHPDAPMTREELAVIVWRMLKDETAPVPSTYLSEFQDRADMASWSSDAMSFMVHKGILTGMTDNMLMPKGTTTRAQATVILTRLLTYFTN